MVAKALTAGVAHAKWHQISRNGFIRIQTECDRNVTICYQMLRRADYNFDLICVSAVTPLYLRCFSFFVLYAPPYSLSLLGVLRIQFDNVKLHLEMPKDSLDLWSQFSYYNAAPQLHTVWNALISVGCSISFS